MKIEKSFLDLGEKIEDGLRESYKMVDLIKGAKFSKSTECFSRGKSP